MQRSDDPNMSALINGICRSCLSEEWVAYVVLGNNNNNNERFIQAHVIVHRQNA